MRIIMSQVAFHKRFYWANETKVLKFEKTLYIQEFFESNSKKSVPLNSLSKANH